MPAYQYVYVMKGLSRTYPGGREVLKDITLSFFPGAKIGVIGVNGSGKSTLLRIMAGLDHDFDGRGVGGRRRQGRLPAAGAAARSRQDGAGERHARARPDQGAARSVEDEISARFAEPLDDDEMAKLLEEQGELQEKIDAANGWELERTVEIAMDALRCPPGDADPATLSGGERRRVALCRLLLEKPDLLLLDEPTNHLDAESVAWLERFLQDYSGTVMVVTHDRYFLDNVTGWILELDRGRGHPLRGQLLLLAGAEAEAPRRRGEAGDGAAAHARARARVDPRQPARPAGEDQGAHPGAYETLLAESRSAPPGTAQITIPPGPRLGELVIEAEHLRKGYGERLLIEDSRASTCRRAASSA